MQHYSSYSSLTTLQERSSRHWNRLQEHSSRHWHTTSWYVVYREINLAHIMSTSPVLHSQSHTVVLTTVYQAWQSKSSSSTCSINPTGIVIIIQVWGFIFWFFSKHVIKSFQILSYETKQLYFSTSNHNALVKYNVHFLQIKCLLFSCMHFI